MRESCRRGSHKVRFLEGLNLTVLEPLPRQWQGLTSFIAGAWAEASCSRAGFFLIQCRGSWVRIDRGALPRKTCWIDPTLRTQSGLGLVLPRLTALAATLPRLLQGSRPGEELRETLD